MSEIIMKYIENSSTIHVETPRRYRSDPQQKRTQTGLFNGVVKDGKGFSSASFEVYVPIVEDATEGIMVVDGSLGYIGKCEQNVRLTITGGRIADIESNPSGDKLRAFIESYADPGLFIAPEFGIGLNSLAK